MNLQRVPKNGNTAYQSIFTSACCLKMKPIGMSLADLDADFGTFWCEDCAVAAGHEMPDATYQLYPRS
jgi:hypothetical protein